MISRDELLKQGKPKTPEPTIGYEIGIPIAARTIPSRRKYPFQQMPVGASIYLTGDDAAAKLKSASAAYVSRHGGEFTVRKLTKNGVVGARLWKTKIETKSTQH